ncbi:hypothetical protein OS493_025861 [Desmophyllum pertusum]|uniref:CUB domain-containing protein n=1 Tax=Desmophyllum pertusum TaxID=174260 RepID=A0A9X0CS23_9CNID|nr:hypothetical protein OS493_025861 [Desmophyllum pertusum]
MGRRGIARVKDDIVGYHTTLDDFYSSGRYMWVIFRSNSLRSDYVGFKATFTAVDETTSSTLTIAIIAGLAVVVVLVCCVGVCIKKRKKTPNRATGDRIPLSTMTTSASHSSPSRVIEHPPPPQAPYQPTANPFSPPPVGYAPVPTNPEVPPPAYPYPLEEPPPYPGEESVPQYPPPGQSYPWQQGSATVEASAPPESP